MLRPKSTRMAVAVVALGLSPGAFAYLDPGAGSMLLQLLIAGILGALFTIKMYWYRLKRFFARCLGREVEDPLSRQTAEPDDEEPRPGTRG